jgi:hypothetical protein
MAAHHLHGFLVLDTGNKFTAGFVVTGDNCSLVLLSPAIKLSLVSLSLAILLTDVAGTCDKFILLSTTPTITENP